MIIINLPMPPKKLNPNISLYWAEKNKDKLIAKNWGMVATLNVKHFFTTDDKLYQIMDVCYGNNKRLDTDNFLASCKSMLDGVYNGLKLNDRQVMTSIVRYVSPDKNNVGITLTIGDINNFRFYIK